jgi:carbamoyltransferase
MHILAFQSGLHDASAAAFEDYRLVAAIAEERLRREKGWGNDIPWLAIDEVLHIAGWSRGDIDAIATIHGVFPLHYFRFSPMREFFTKRKVRDRAAQARSRAIICPVKRIGCVAFSAPTGSLREQLRPRPKYSLPISRRACIAAFRCTRLERRAESTADGIGEQHRSRSARCGRIASDVAFGATACWPDRAPPAIPLLPAARRGLRLACGGFQGR